MHASKDRKYYACTEKRSQKRREIMVTITRRDLCRLALLSLMVAFDGRSYMAVAVLFGVWKSSTTSTLFFASPVADFVLHVFSRRRTRSCRPSTSDFRVRITAAAFLAHAVISATQAFKSTV